MLIECIGNAYEHLSCEYARQAYNKNIHQDEVCLEIGKKYIVYGIIFRDREGFPWFLVCEDDEDEYPKPHLGAFFKIIDGDIPAAWAFSTECTNSGRIGILPKKWASDPYFMEKLVDGETEALNYFCQLKNRSSSCSAEK